MTITDRITKILTEAGQVVTVPELLQELGKLGIMQTSSSIAPFLTRAKKAGRIRAVRRGAYVVTAQELERHGQRLKAGFDAFRDEVAGAGAAGLDATDEIQLSVALPASRLQEFRRILQLSGFAYLI